MRRTSYIRCWLCGRLSLWSPGPGQPVGTSSSLTVNFAISTPSDLNTPNCHPYQHYISLYVLNLYSVLYKIHIFQKEPPEHYQCGVQSVSTIMKTSEQLAAQFSRSLPRVQSVGSWCSQQVSLCQVYGLEGATKWKITRNHRIVFKLDGRRTDAVKVE